MEKRNTLLLTVVAIATLFVTVIGATFAYFASNIQNGGNVGVNVNTSNKQASFIATSNGSLTIDVESYMMQQGNAGDGSSTTSNDGNIAKMLTSNATLNVSLTASDDKQTTECSYDLIYTWTGNDDNFSSYSSAPKGDSNNVYPSKYYVRSASSITEGFKELTITVDAEDIYVGEKETERTYSSEILAETNIDELKPYQGSSENKILTLKAGETISSQSTTNPTHVDYRVTAKFYNLETNQDTLMNKKFNGTIGIANVKC